MKLKRYNYGWSRKKRIKEEANWNKVGEWWYRLPEEPKGSLFQWQINIAHQCDEDTYRAVGALMVWKGKKRVTVNAYCSGCRAKMPTKLRTIIFLSGSHSVTY